MKCILFGGSGEVGGAVARALIDSEVCSQLTLLGRRVVPALESQAKVEQIVVDTSAADFEQVVKEKARGHDVAISCVGIGSGSASMPEEELMAIEVHLPGQFARGSKAAGIEIFETFTGVGVNAKTADSRFKAIRAVGMKHRAVVEAGFEKLVIFKPSMIVGNSHTPRWITPLTGLIPDALSWGNIHQDDLARAFVAYLEKRVASQTEPVVFYGNREMKQLIRAYRLNTQDKELEQ